MRTQRITGPVSIVATSDADNQGRTSSRRITTSHSATSKWPAQYPNRFVKRTGPTSQAG